MGGAIPWARDQFICLFACLFVFNWVSEGRGLGSSKLHVLVLYQLLTAVSFLP